MTHWMRAGVLLTLLLAPAAAPGGPAATPTTAPDPDEFSNLPGALRGVSLAIELRADRDLGALEAALDAVSAAGGEATVVVTAELAAREGARIAAARKAGHEIALWMDTPENAGRGMDGVDSWKRAGREQLKAVKKASGARPRTALVDTLPRTGEVAMDALRFRTVRVDRTGTPKRIVDLSGIPGGLVLPAAGEPGVVDLDPVTLDTVSRRMEQVLERGFPTVVLSLDLAAVDEEGAAMLGRWLIEVIEPTGAKVVSARNIPLRATASTGAEDEQTPAVVARPVDLNDLEVAAAELVEAARIPRQLSPGINPTEAFLAFCMVLAEPEPPERVLLGGLNPPAEEARSALSGGETLPRASIVAAAAAIAPYLSYQVPNLIDAGDYTLTAAEFLVAMARALPGDTDPVPLVTPGNPDPYSAGLGWGASTGR
jgi:hypothetical protein